MAKSRVITVFLDGTFGHPELETKPDENGKEHYLPSNVWRQYEAMTNLLRYTGKENLPKDMTVSAYYHRGVGAPADKNGDVDVHKEFNAAAADRRKMPYKKDYGIDGLKNMKLWQVFSFITGHGLSDILLNSYRHVSEQLAIARENGEEPHIQVFGFSRGAATARSLVAMLDRYGPARVDADGKALEKDVKRAMSIYKRPDNARTKRLENKFAKQKGLGKGTIVDYLGVYDTVSALGVPDSLPMLREIVKSMFARTKLAHDFHDLKLPPNVRVARQAVAADEMRIEFNLKAWKQNPGDCDIEQRVFPGSHGNIGGGLVHDMRIPDATMKWIMEEAQATLDKDFGQDKVLLHSTHSSLHIPPPEWEFSPGHEGEIVESHKKLPYCLTHNVSHLWEKGGFKRDLTDAINLTLSPEFQERLRQSNSYAARTRAIIPDNTPRIQPS